MIAQHFNEAYPEYAAKEWHADDCFNIEEPQNYNTNKFERLSVTGLDCFQFPHCLASKLSSFATMSNCTGNIGCLTLDCDSILLVEKADCIYVICCELKSTFSSEEISKAKNQIVGSSVKFKGILSTLQDVDFQKIKSLALLSLSSLPPSKWMLFQSLKTIEKAFAFQLQSERLYKMPSLSCNRFFSPLNVGDVELHYIPVPDRQSTFQVDLGKLLGI